MNTPLTPLPVPNVADLYHLSGCDASVRVRRLIERGIVRKLLDELLAQGWTITVDDGEERHTAPADLLAADLIEHHMANIFAVDECHLYLGKGNVRGVVFFVFGNDGWDCINDYSSNLDLHVIDEYVDAMSEWA